jgi:hypothetical protein
MTTLRRDTYCGLYCGACEIVNAKTDEQKHRFIQMFESCIPGWQASLDQMRCSGCKIEDVFVNCGKRPIRPCARAKGVEFCLECAGLPMHDAHVPSGGFRTDVCPGTRQGHRDEPEVYLKTRP